MRAQQGGGYTLFLYQDPQNNLETRMLLGYVIPADDEDWYIFAGTFLNGTIPVRPDLMDELAVFARSIHQFIELTDRNAAITSLNNENEQFLNPRNIQYGIFDYNGTALVWPHNPDRIGTSALGMTDIYGGSLIRDLITYAKEGGGFMYQYYPDTRTGESLLKLVYVEPLGGDQLLVANIPLI
jgi:signal transduction histidine kinase